MGGGQAQPAIARLAAAGAMRGAVLDAGCGSGDNAFLVVALGNIASLASVTEAGATSYVLCFRAGVPGPGPHPMSENDLRSTLRPTAGWQITDIAADRGLTNGHGSDGAAARNG